MSDEKKIQLPFIAIGPAEPVPEANRRVDSSPSETPAVVHVIDNGRTACGRTDVTGPGVSYDNWFEATCAECLEVMDDADAADNAALSE